MNNGLFVLIPIMFLGIAVTGIIATTFLKMQKLRLEEAQLRAGDVGDLNDLARKVSDLQDELADVQERLEFAERMLAQVKDSPGLPAGQPRQELP
jgi:hypothetical protein